VRVVIADDSLLVREGITALLRRAGFDVVAQAGSGDELLREVEAHDPDVAIVDIRMPPGYEDEGIRAAQVIRARHERTAIVILSEHVELGTATVVLAERPARLGYLLKHRVTDLDDFAATLRRVAAGGTALDPEVVSRLIAAPHEHDPLATLTAREREVLQLVAEGRSNKGIADRLVVTERAVQKHVTSIFCKLGLESGEDDNRRILAVLAYLSPARGAAPAGTGR
jgi:DNA-binding NarL/FixJ family response regulator